MNPESQSINLKESQYLLTLMVGVNMQAKGNRMMQNGLLHEREIPANVINLLDMLKTVPVFKENFEFIDEELFLDPLYREQLPLLKQNSVPEQASTIATGFMNRGKNYHSKIAQIYQDEISLQEITKEDADYLILLLTLADTASAYFMNEGINS